MQIFFWLGVAPRAAFGVAQVPPFNLPMVVSLTFWGALYGGGFGFLTSRLRGRIWLNGLPLGLLATLMAWFVFQPLKGLAAAFGWQAWPMLRSLIAWEIWGLGVGIILPLLHPRRIGASRAPWQRTTLAT
ncbi:hypothetical protein [Rhodopila sp.]|uniref:hypothetical protein n=1 Tax=Rhodopila sp. TaxID=2480087 RepID=UPI003D132089